MPHLPFVGARRALLSVAVIIVPFGGALGACGSEPSGIVGAGGSAGAPSSGATGGAGGAEIFTCPEPVTPDTTALHFDGSDGVSMGVAPDLGADHFTLEAWVRRDGDGKEASTGVGGIRHVPLITKGRGESDGTNVDCNYALGFVGEVIGADFEDYESGANHPVIGTTQIDRGRWYHVAATYDGAHFRLYVDGKLDAERVEDATPRYDSIQHFGLGVALNSSGTRAGAFEGALDEVRVYSRALDGEEIRETMYSRAPNLLGLIGHFPLDASDGAVVDVSGHESHGDGIAAGFVAPGPILDAGRAPVVATTASTSAGDALTLEVEVADYEGDALQVAFFARELSEDDDFTVVVIPDSQYYTRDASPPARPEPDDPEYFYEQTRWAVTNRAAANVVGLFHVGDIVNNADVPAQWDRAENAFEILEQAVDTSFPHGIPYGLSFGNHDQFPRNEPDATTEANERFGVARFADRAYYGGNFNGDNDESWVRFQAGDLELVVVNMQFNPSPDPAVLSWARRVFETHPRALGIVNSHYIVTGGGNFSAQGQAIYDALKDVPNLQLMASGHVAVDARRTDEFEGNVIHSMLSDYQRAAPDPDDPSQPIIVEQSLTNGGHGFMRIWRFSPSQQKLYVRTHSPKLDADYTDDRNEFELDVDIVGAGSDFALVGTAEVAEGRAAIVIEATAGARYEWYAVATDCIHESSTAIELTTVE